MKNRPVFGMKFAEGRGEGDDFCEFYDRAEKNPTRNSF